MQVLIGGGIAAVFGLIGLMLWWGDFISILKGAIPIGLLLGGALAMYVGYDEVKDQLKEKRGGGQEASSDELAKAKEELKKAQEEAEKFKKELEKAKESKAPAKKK